MKRPVRNIILLLAIGLLGTCSVSQATTYPGRAFDEDGKTVESPSSGSSPHEMAGRLSSIHTLLIAKGET
jgi:hypothetical protein